MGPVTQYANEGVRNCYNEALTSGIFMGIERSRSIVIDCHYHYEEEVLSAKELIHRMDSSGVYKVALMAPLNQLIPSPNSFTINVMCYFLSRPLLRAIPGKVLTNFTNEGKIKLPGGTFRVYTDPDNESIFNIVGRHPDRFLGWVFVNPKSENDHMEVLSRWIRLESCVGAKAHPFWHRYPPAELSRVADLLVKLNKPLLIHCGFKPHDDFLGLINEFPDLKLIVAHAGFPYYSSVWKKIKKRKNVYVDLSQISYVNEKITRDVVEYLGAEKCIFGTDGPTGTASSVSACDYGYIKRRIERIFQDEKVRRKLLGENFAGLIGPQ